MYQQHLHYAEGTSINLTCHLWIFGVNTSPEPSVSLVILRLSCVVTSFSKMTGLLQVRFVAPPVSPHTVPSDLFVIEILLLARFKMGRLRISGLFLT